MIKRYEGGRFSGLLGDGGIKADDALQVTGPYGVFTLRTSSPRRLVFIGGGAGMAPILCLLRSMAEAGVERPATYYYGARTETDLFHLDELAERGRLPGFTFVPALSEATHAGPARAGSSPTSSTARRRPERGRRLPLRSAADGRRRHRPARSQGRAGGAHLLRQVHHDRTSVRGASMATDIP